MLQNIKTLAVLLFTGFIIVAVTVESEGQSYSANPSGYLANPFVVSCGTSYDGGVVEGRWYTSSPEAFRVRKETGSFSSGGQVRIYENSACSSNLIVSQSYSAGASTVTVNLPASFISSWLGTKTFRLVVHSNTGDRFNAGITDVTRTCVDYHVQSVDAYIQGTSTSTTTLVAGERYDFESFVSNDGNATGTDDITYYLSTNTTFGSTDIEIDNEFFTLGGGQSTVVSMQNERVSSSTPPGNYYLLAVADDNDGDSECAEYNNTAFQFVTVVGQPDLTVSSISVNRTDACEDGTVTVSYSIKNEGTGSSNSLFRVGFYLSTNTSFGSSDIFLEDEIIFSSFSPNQTRSYNETVSLTTGTASQYYILVRVDYQNDITESDELNNLENTPEIDRFPSPQLISPSNGAIVNAQPILDWSSVPNANQYAVGVLEAGTSNLVWDDVTGSATQAQVPIGELTPGEDYDWFAGVQLSNGTNCPSLARTFTVQCNDNFEPNNSRQTPNTTAFSSFSGTAPSQQSISAFITDASDQDNYRIDVAGPCILDIDLTSIPSGQNYELELWPVGSAGTVLQTSINTGNANENVQYTHNGGATGFVVKIYPYQTSGSCTNGYNLSVDYTPTTTGGGLELDDDLNIIPANYAVVGEPLALDFEVRNTAPQAWTGLLRVAIINATTGAVNSAYNSDPVTISPNQSLALSRPSASVGSAPDSYTFEVQYQDPGSQIWSAVSEGNFTNPIGYRIYDKALQLAGPLNATPNPGIRNQPFQFETSVVNRSQYGQTATLEYKIVDSTQSPIFDVAFLSQTVTLTPGETVALTPFSTASLGSNIGSDYELQLVRLIAGTPELVGKGDHVNPIDFEIVDAPGTITVVTPNGPAQGPYAQGGIIPISWNTQNLTGTLDFILVGPSGNTISIYSDESNVSPYDFVLPPCVQSGTGYTIRIQSHQTPTIFDESDAPFEIQGTSTPCPCTFTVPSAPTYSQELVNATQWICGQGAINAALNNGDTRPNDPITRGELAKIVAILLQGTTSTGFPTDNFPSPYLDLQDPTAWYYPFAKYLLYLEFGDGVTPFDRDLGEFRAEDSINRQYVVKVILEAFDLAPDPSLTENFGDVDNTTDSYAYIVTAVRECMVNGSIPDFRPEAPATRGEVFLMLYRLMDATSVPACTATSAPTVNNQNDLACPGNYTPANMSRSVGLIEGSFDSYKRNVFSIPGIDLGLSFGFWYRSYLTELPGELIPMKPLGEGWSHSYSSSVVSYLGYTSDGTTVEARYALTLPDGRIEVFTNPGGAYPRICAPVTLGVFDTLVAVDASTIELRTRALSTWTYKDHPVSSTRNAFLLEKIRTRRGHEIDVSYQAGADGSDRVSTAVLQLGNSNTARRTLTFSYAANSNYLNDVRINGVQHASVQFTVNSDGDLINYTDRGSKMTVYEYPVAIDPATDQASKTAHLLTGIVLPKGNRIDNTYDLKRKLSSSQANGNYVTTLTQNFNYNAGGPNTYKSETNLGNSGTNAPKQVTNMTQDPVTGRATQLSNEARNYSITYDSQYPTFPKKIVDGALTVDFLYDGKADLKERKETFTGANAQTRIHKYDVNVYHDITKYTDPKNNEVLFDYGSNPALGLVYSITDQVGSTTTYDYYQPSTGQHKSYGLKEMTSPMGVTINYDYDGFGNLASVVAPRGISTSTLYDDLGRPKEILDPRSKLWKYTYNPVGLPEQVTDPDNYTVINGYDDNYNLTSITNELGRITSMVYDHATDQLDSRSFGGATETYDYFADGRLKDVTRPMQEVNALTYVQMGAGIGQVETDARSMYTYDGRGRRATSTTNENGQTFVLSYFYDALDRVVSVQVTASGLANYTHTIGYEYDLNGNVEKIKYPNLAGSGSLDVEYGYYDDNTLHTITDWEGDITTYTYHPDKAIDKVVLPNGTERRYSYESDTRRLNGMSDVDFSGTTISSYSYVLDDAGNITSETINAQPIMSRPPSPGVDAYIMGTRNEVTSFNGASVNVDLNGETITDGLGATYVYNDFGHLVSYNNGTETVQHYYDAGGVRRQRGTSTGQESYAIDVLGLGNIIAEFGPNGPTRYHVYGMGLEYSKEVVGSNYEIRVHHYNYQGSTVGVTDDQGQIVASYTYSPYGQVIDSTGSYDTPFTFNGRYGVYSDIDGLIHMRARVYDTDMRRFLTEDPVWSTNLFGFGGGNPVGFTDEDGRSGIRIKHWKAFDHRSLNAWNSVATSTFASIEKGRGTFSRFAKYTPEAISYVALGYDMYDAINNQGYSEAQALLVHGGGFALDLGKDKIALALGTGLCGPACGAGLVLVNPLIDAGSQKVGSAIDRATEPFAKELYNLGSTISSVYKEYGLQPLSAPIQYDYINHMCHDIQH